MKGAGSSTECAGKRMQNNQNKQAQREREAKGESFGLFHDETVKLFLLHFGLEPPVEPIASRRSGRQRRRDSAAWSERNTKVRQAMQAAIDRVAASPAAVMNDTPNAELALRRGIMRDQAKRGRLVG